MIQSEHMKSCLATQKCYLLFKGPGSFKKKLNRRKCKGFTGLSIDTTHTPLPGHFTVPLRKFCEKNVCTQKKYDEIRSFDGKCSCLQPGVSWIRVCHIHNFFISFEGNLSESGSYSFHICMFR
jgi:hypothetical protein